MHRGNSTYCAHTKSSFMVVESESPVYSRTVQQPAASRLQSCTRHSRRRTLFGVTRRTTAATWCCMPPPRRGSKLCLFHSVNCRIARSTGCLTRRVWNRLDSLDCAQAPGFRTCSGGKNFWPLGNSVTSHAWCTRAGWRSHHHSSACVCARLCGCHTGAVKTG